MQNAEVTTVAKADGSVWITIDRPHKHNALGGGVLQALDAAVRETGAAAGARCIVVTGAGDRYFAAGGDLVELAQVRDEAATRAMTDASRRALDAVRDCPLPVLAYLNGDAIGGGAELALGCDLRLQASHARIGFVQARLAITSAWGGGPDLCQLVGPARALRMMSRCEMVGAEQALQWGLADAVITDGADGRDLADFIAPLLRCPPQVLRGIKAQTLAMRQGLAYDARRAVEQQQLLATWLHDDHWRAAGAVLSKGTK